MFVALLTAGVAIGCGPAAPSISDRELLSRLESSDPPVVLDVRTPQEFAAGHIVGALNIPIDEVEGRLGELDGARTGEVVVYCEKGPRALKALAVLERAGFAGARHLEGDMSAWREQQLPCVGC